MGAKTAVGILGVGAFLPDEVRTNDFWPRRVVDSWRERGTRRPEPPPPVGEGQALVYQALAALADDPFRGARERRVMPAGMDASDMEIAAGREAITRAGISADAIDLLLVYSTVPDYLTTNGACTVHEGLGLPKACFSLSVEGGCNAFQQQVTLAEAMISAGRARTALLVQSCSLSRLLRYDEQSSAWFGDGATAVVMGGVGSGKGLLGSAHRTDGALQCGLVGGVPGGRWFDDGRAVLYVANGDRTHKMLVGVPEYARDAIDGALADAGLSRADASFYACHQAFPWLRSLTQAYAGLDHTRTIDTFSWAGSLSAANIPLVLASGEREGLLRDDDVVVTHSGGSGITWSSLVLRWQFNERGFVQSPRHSLS